MDPKAETRSSITADLSVDAIRRAVNIAQSECVCQLHLSVCLLTAAGERAGIQPFLYESGSPGWN
ncbi:hypothetical protein EZ313_02015 [Ramlibacter henchirensis]|uniref:Uncharacterized protein n=1 Tax=Ramlibacter henchirensis TaxID=204072 RepID=A0A4Z0C3G1_9BURK|nr:hypothetical protein [Ramlibacter henchirensis]TFZ05472.1 hypothetical protein EZ313_02015 [Ramlibacter henchirensis]